MIATDFTARLDEIVLTIRTVIDGSGATGEPYVVVGRRMSPEEIAAAELERMVTEVAEYWARRERARLAGERLASRTTRPRPTTPIAPARPRRRESQRQWQQAIRAFRGRVQ